MLNESSFKKIFLISRNKQNIIFTAKNVMYLQKQKIFANYIFYTNLGLASIDMLVKKKLGGILLFKII